MKKSRSARLGLFKRVMLTVVTILTFGILPACSGTPVATPTPTSEAEAIYKAGTYTSEQDTGFATVVITAEFDETSLKSVSYEVTDSRDNDYFPNYEEDLKAVCDSIVTQQTTEVDGVSGATLCSQAIKKGVNDSIAQASLVPVEPAATPSPVAEGDFYEQVGDWLYSKDVTSASSAGAFLPGEENTPTEEDIRRILETANNYQWCHMLTAPHFIVIRDPDEQHEILQEMGVTGDGTVTILVLADGVKDQEHHAELYDGRDLPHDVQHYWRMYYCIYEAGEAASMLNLAARSLGYRTRNYGALHLYNQGYKDQFPEEDGISIWYSGGNFDYIGGENWDISKYCSPKEGGEPFQHWFGGGGPDRSGKYVDVEDNLTLLCAIVVGRVDETDALSSATVSEDSNLSQKTYNYDFWD